VCFVSLRRKEERREKREREKKREEEKNKVVSLKTKEVYQVLF